MTVGLRTFISEIKESIQKSAKSNASVIFVTGNESADLDSCASSILSSYWHSIYLEKGSSNSSNGQLIVPLLNIPRRDLALRPDVVSLLKDLDISSNWLLFLDDPEITNDLVAKGSAFLVDHNRLTGKPSKFFQDRVVGILDHHEDEHLYTESIAKAEGPRIIEKSGSCSSLVVDYWNNKLKQAGINSFCSSHDDKKNASVLARLALAPLLLDTTNMRFRVEQKDRESFKILIDQLPQFNVTQFFETLDFQKKDISILQASDILRKDYKELDINQGKLGISSIPQSLEWINQRYPNFEDAATSWAVERKLEILAIMTTYVDDTGNFNRELAFHAESNEQNVLDFVKSSSLGLEPKKMAFHQLKTFQQTNISASRKQVAPLLKEYLDKNGP